MSVLRKIGVVLGVASEPEPEPEPEIGPSFDPPKEVWRALYYLKDPGRTSLVDRIPFDGYFESREKFWDWLRRTRRGEAFLSASIRVEMIRLDVRVGDRWIRFEVDEAAERLVLHGGEAK